MPPNHVFYRVVPFFEPRDLWVGLYIGKRESSGPHVKREFFVVVLGFGLRIERWESWRHL